MVTLKEIKKKLKGFKTLGAQKKYLEGILKETKDEYIIDAVNKLLEEIKELIDKQNKAAKVIKKTIDDLFSKEGEEIKLPETPTSEVVREAKKYYVSERQEPKQLERTVGRATGVVKYEAAGPPETYVAGREDKIEAVRSYMKDVKRMTTTFNESVFEGWKGTEQMDDLYNIVEKTFGTSDPIELGRTVREVMNVQDQYTKRGEGFAEKYLKRKT
jgi:wobble nucleotide-excising tRNase